MKISLMILMKQLEIHLMNSLNFTSTVEDLLKIKKSVASQTYVNRDLRI
jgi:hypothetical protein